MARSISSLPAGTAIIVIGGRYYPVILLPEFGRDAFEHVKDRLGGNLSFTRRYAAAQYLWRCEREEMEA